MSNHDITLFMNVINNNVNNIIAPMINHIALKKMSMFNSDFST